MENPDEQAIKNNRDFLDQEKIKLYMRLRENSLAEFNKAGLEFSQLEIHIASALLAFSAAGSLIDSGSNDSTLLEALLLIIAWSLLIISLFLGLLCSHLKQKFFEKDIEKFSFL